MNAILMQNKNKMKRGYDDMTEVMKVNVTFYGNYGGDVNEMALLPKDINGVLFDSLEEGTYDSAVYLGEIEGKHSECYGDLSVEFVDLGKLSIKQVTDLIKQSSIGEFECYFEGREEGFAYLEEYDEEKAKEIIKLYGAKPERWSIKTALVHEKFIEQLKDRYVKNFKTILVLEENYEDAMSVLHNSGVETFE